jgi:hypothetical protein
MRLRIRRIRTPGHAANRQCPLGKRPLRCPAPGLRSIGVGASREQSHSNTAGVRTRRAIQQPTATATATGVPPLQKSFSSSSSPRPRPTAHRSTGGHKGHKTPQPAPAAEATTTNNSSTKRPCYGASAAATTSYTSLTQLLGACCIYIYISTPAICIYNKYK